MGAKNLSFQDNRWVQILVMLVIVCFCPQFSLAKPSFVIPKRVVSIHLCADQLLLALADKFQIASVSHLAKDPVRSHMAASAKNVAVNYGGAEEVITYKPDLILAGAQSTRTTVIALKRLGFNVVDLAFTNNFEKIRFQIQRVANLLGHPKRGEKLVLKMNHALNQVSIPKGSKQPLAAIYQPMGFTSGSGSLENTLLVSAGFENLAARQGLGALSHLTLENLVLAQPELLVNWMGNDRHPSLARAGYQHPVFSKGNWKMITIPQKYWACGSWYSAEAVKFLSELRGSIKRE